MKRSLRHLYVVLFASLISRMSFADPPPVEDPDPVPRPAFSLGAERVDPFLGSFSSELALDVPKFHGLEPQLALVYNSSGGNGITGVGWSLRGFSTIERATPGKGAGSFGFHGTNLQDIFLLDGQELVPCAQALSSPSCTSGGTHTTKIESYQRIKRETASPFFGEQVTDMWTVTKKDGTRTIYTPILTITGAINGTSRWGVRHVISTLR